MSSNLARLGPLTWAEEFSMTQALGSDRPWGVGYEGDLGVFVSVKIAQMVLSEYVVKDDVGDSGDRHRGDYFERG